MDELSLRLFKLSSAGFCCSQIMYKLALEDEGSSNDDRSTRPTTTASSFTARGIRTAMRRGWT